MTDTSRKITQHPKTHSNKILSISFAYKFCLRTPQKALLEDLYLTAHCPTTPLVIGNSVSRIQRTPSVGSTDGRVP